MKKIILLVFSITCVLACKDFTESKLTNGTNVHREVKGSQEILGDHSTINSGNFNIDKLILNIGLNVVYPSTVNLAAKLEKLDSTIKLYCDVVKNSAENAVLKLALQTSWKESMEAYHYLEAFKFGPIMQNGEEIGLAIYSWPLLNACRVELEIAKNTGKADYQLKSGVNLKGLGALETILFTASGKHNCASTPDFLQNWLASSEKQRHLDQCHYMLLVSQDLGIQASALKKKWDPKFGNLTLSLIKGQNLQKKLSVVNEISNSIFYVEKIIKDQKVGAPSGMINCQFNSCPEKSEHLIAQFSIEAIIQNLTGFKDVFNGIDQQTGLNGFGLDDYLENQGHPQVAKDLNAALNQALKSFEKHRGKKSLFELAQEVDKAQCLASTSEERLVEICSLYTDLRTLTTILKNDYVLALRDIQAPKDSQGDMD